MGVAGMGIDWQGHCITPRLTNPLQYFAKWYLFSQYMHRTAVAWLGAYSQRTEQNCSRVHWTIRAVYWFQFRSRLLLLSMSDCFSPRWELRTSLSTSLNRTIFVSGIPNHPFWKSQGTLMLHETAAGSMSAGGTPSASNPWKCKALHIRFDCGNRLLWRPDTSDTLPSPHQRQSGGALQSDIW